MLKSTNMDLADLARRGSASEALGEWPFSIVTLSRELAAGLAGPEALRGIATQIQDIAEKFECTAIVGASRFGDELAGAVVATSGNGLRIFSTEEPTESVLVIDGVLSTGAQILRMIRTAKNGGAKRAVGLAILGSSQALKWCKEEIGEPVMALEEF